jgi:hypothetical protein
MDFGKSSRGGIKGSGAFTRPHGEYTHALQWLVMAYRFKKSSTKVADLYANSVKYISNKDSIVRNNRSRKIYIWNFLVDCFPGPEEFETHITCETFRCPQIVTDRLVWLPPHSWLGAFISATSELGLRREFPHPNLVTTNAAVRRATLPTWSSFRLGSLFSCSPFDSVN